RADHPPEAPRGVPAVGVPARARDGGCHRASQGAAQPAGGAARPDGLMDLPRTAEEGRAFLESRSPSTVVLGLERVQEALSELGHMEFLGETLAAIAREKAAIFRTGAPAVAAAQHPEAQAVIEACAAAAGTPLLREGREFSFDALGRYVGPGGTLEGLALGLH